MMRVCSFLLSDSLEFPDLGMVYHIRSFVLWMDGSHGEAQKYDILLQGDLSLLLDTLHGPNHGPEFFGFHASYNSRGGLEYTKIDPSIISALDRMYHSPNLRHLLFRGIRNLPGTLLKGTNINTLEIYDKTATNIGFIQNTPRVIALDSMGMDDPFDAASLRHSEDETILRPRFQAFPGPRKMYFTVSSLIALPKVINTVINIAGCLQILHIQLTGYTCVEAPPNPQYPFHLLTSLTSLHISSSENSLSHASPAVLPFLPVLEICTLPPSLKRLHLETRTSGQDDSLDCIDTHADRDRWLRMDALLMRPTFTAVRHLEITLFHSVYSRFGFSIPHFNIGDFQGLLRNRLLDVLPKFSQSSSGCLNVVLSPGAYKILVPPRSQVVPRCGPRLKLEVPIIMKHHPWQHGPY